MSPTGTGVRFTAALIGRTAVLGLIWIVLVDGAVSSWWVGVPVVLLAAAVTRSMRSSFPIVWWELFRFIPFFVGRSLIGGLDVARRALDPRLPLDPAVIEYPLRVPDGFPRVVLANTVNLLPGTLTAGLKAEALQVHVIDRQAPFFEELVAVENAVARLFGIALEKPRGG